MPLSFLYFKINLIEFLSPMKSKNIFLSFSFHLTGTFSTLAAAMILSKVVPGRLELAF